MDLMKSLIIEEEGQGLVEYALIVGLIALVAVGVMTILGTDISAMFTKISTELTK